MPSNRLQAPAGQKSCPVPRRPSSSLAHSVYEYTSCACIRVYRCAVSMRAWVCTCTRYPEEQVGKHPCSCSPGGIRKPVPRAVVGQVRRCAGASSHQLTGTESTRLFPTPRLVSHVGSLKLAMVGVFIPQKSANATNQDLFIMTADVNA